MASEGEGGEVTWRSGGPGLRREGEERVWKIREEEKDMTARRGEGRDERRR